MPCGCNGGTVPGTGQAQGLVQGRKMVHRILDTETDECIINPETGSCAEFRTDTAAFRFWYSTNQTGYVRSMWVSPVVDSSQEVM